MPTSSTTLRRPRPTSAPLFKHSYITFIGHWKGQLCILVVVLIVGLIYFVIREPIEKWRRQRRERLSAWAREGLLAAERKGKEKEKEREKAKERSRVGDRDRSPASAQLQLGSDGEKTVLGQVGASGAGAGPGNASRAGQQGQGQGPSTGFTSALATSSTENRKSRRRKSSVLKVDTGLLSASQGSAGMSKTGSGISTASLTSGASGASGVSSRSGTPSLALASVSEVDTSERAVPAMQGDQAVEGEAGPRDDEVGEEDAEGGKRSSALDKGKGRAVPLGHSNSTSTTNATALVNEIARPSPIHIHIRQPTVVVDSAEVQNLHSAGAYDDAGSDDAAYAGEGSAKEPRHGKGRKHAESVGSSVAMSLSDSGSHDASSSDQEHGDCNAATSHITGGASESLPTAKDEKDNGKKRDEGFSIFPDEGWLPPSALAALAAGEKKKKKKGKGTGAAISVTAANIAHANGLVKNGESSRMATGTSSSGSVSGRSVTSAGTGSGAGSGTGLGESPASHSSVLPPLPSFGSSTSIPNSGSASQSGAEVDASTNTKTNATSTPPLTPITSNPTSVASSAHQHRSRPTGNSFGHAGHSRKASMGKISGISSLEEQIRERDEIIDSLRAEVGRAKAEEMKARGELEMRVISEDQGVLGPGKGEERSSGRRSSVQKQLAEALAGMSSQASRIEMLEQIIASSGLSVPSSHSTGPHADHYGAQTAQTQSNGNHRRQSHHQHQQPRLNRIVSMPNGSAHQQPNGHAPQHLGTLAVPVSPMHPQMTGQQQQQQHPGQSPMMRHMGGMTPLQHPHQPNSPFMPSPNPNIGMGMQSPHLPYAYSPVVQAQMQAYNAQLQMQGQGQGQAMMHPLAHQQQMAQMQIQMMHGPQMQIQQVQHQHPHSARPYTPQRHSFHYANGTMNGNGAAPTSPSPYRRMSTATSASASTGRNIDREHGRLRDGSNNNSSNEASQSDRERERDEVLGVADHPLAGPLTPGHHHHHAHVSSSPARYAASANGSDGQGTQGIFGALQADRDRTNGEVHEANGFNHMGMVGGYGGLGFPSMQEGIDVGALGYADTGIGRPPGEERAAEGQRRASVESSVLKRKPIEPMTTASASASATGAAGSADGDALILEEEGAGVADSGKMAAEGVVPEVGSDKGEDKGEDAERRLGDHEELASDAPKSNMVNGKQDQESSNTSSPPSSGPTSPRSRQVLVTPGSTILEVHDHDNPQDAGKSSNGIKEEDEQQHDNVGLVSPSPSPLPRAQSSNQNRMSVHVPPQNLSPMLYPMAVANGQAQVNGYHHHHHHPSPSPSPHLAHFSHAHMGQPSPVLPLSIPLPVSPVPMGGGMYPFPQASQAIQAQLNGYAAGGQGAKHSSAHYENHTGHGLKQGQAEHAPTSSTPLKLKLPDYTPTFASVAHTPEQLMEIKRMNEEAVRRAVEESRA